MTYTSHDEIERDFDQLEQDLYSAVLSDALDAVGYRHQAMAARLRPVYPGAKFIGRAHTILSSDYYSTPDEPYEPEINAIDSVSPGSVAVVGTNRSNRTCVWGELLSTASRVHGGRGAVIDGYVRDVRKIAEIEFPVFSTGMSPVDSNGRGIVIGHGIPVECGGVIVNPGEIVFGDVDGIVVIPRDIEIEVINRALEKTQGEGHMRAYLLEGHTLREAYEKFGFL